MTPYQPRPIRSFGLWRVDGWQLKIYGISYGRPLPQPELINAAREVAEKVLRELPDGLPHDHIGFLGVHDGRTSHFVFLDFWANENELRHHVYVSPSDDPAALVKATPSGLSACVWDLQVQAFERDAWVGHVLRSDGTPDFSGNLAATLEVTA